MTVHRYIARLVVECTSPLAISTGDDDPLLDNKIARDVNGLPLLPATSIVGMLRARLTEDQAGQWLGNVGATEARRSLIDVTDGLVHWSKGGPRDGRQSLARLEADALCRLLLEDSPVTRDHVRLDGRGVVDGDGKFQRSAVPTGTRFTFEMRSSDKPALLHLVELVKAGLVLGGATRAGYGQLQCMALGMQELDLATEQGWADYCRIASADIGENSPIVCNPVNQGAMARSGWRVSGQIEGPLLIGALGGTVLQQKRVPYCETAVVWSAGTGTLEKVTIVPGSSIKGPLRHRTAFHLARLVTEEEVDDLMAELFGRAADKDDALAGALRFHDARPEDFAVLEDIRHVSLDRFAGGARDGALFADDMLWQPRLDLLIDQLRPLSDEAVMAFEQALEDMVNGLCGIGAEWGEGAGIFGSAEVVRNGQPFVNTGAAA